jgi:GTP-binding protein EngB required for normal cell division
MSLWDEEDNSNVDNNDYIDNQDFSNKEYRQFLINTLVNYSKCNNLVNELFEKLSINLIDISKENKEKILEIFTKNSKLLYSENSYLNNPIKGMRLISDIIYSKNRNNKSELELLFDKFDYYLNNDFIEFSSQISIPNEAKLYKELISIRDELFEDIKFSELVNKTLIGIGGSFSAGKSSFLNSILDRDVNADDILPTDTNPTTSIPTYLVKKDSSISSNNDTDIYTFNKDGEKSKIDKEALLAISHEFNKIYNFGLISIVNKIVVDIGCMPYENIAFLDTPGYSKSDGEEDIDENIAQNHLRNIDSMIWLIDAENGVIQHGDIKFIQSLDFNKEILFILNKADKKPKSDIKSILSTVKNSLNKANIKYTDVVAYSSHEKKEYFSVNKIECFLTKHNKSKKINFQLKIKDILKEYEKHIKDIGQKNKALLEIFNQIDTLGYSFISEVDNFENMLDKVKKDILKNNKDKINYMQLEEFLIRSIGSIDTFFNQRIYQENNKKKFKLYSTKKFPIWKIEEISRKERLLLPTFSEIQKLDKNMKDSLICKKIHYVLLSNDKQTSYNLKNGKLLEFKNSYFIYRER